MGSSSDPGIFVCHWILQMKKQDDQFSEKEAAARRDAVIKRMIAMPPKPHSEMNVGKKKSAVKKKPKSR
jgi:hypothetical protein